MANTYFEEEEFTTQFNGRTLRRILAQTRPHWTWVAGFLVLITIVSVLDGYFTFLSKRIIDQGILAGDQPALMRLHRPVRRADPGPGRMCFRRSSSWSQSWASASSTTCARKCSGTCRSCRSPTSTARRWAGS